jgi:CelD/BcsL family acetyltransferase involved in cellulose biosynthesis
VSAPQTASYEVYEGTEGLGSLRSAWESLEEAGADHIFQTYAHADLWQRTVGAPSGAKPLLIALREGERVVGIFPACRVRQSGMPLLTWLGAPRVLDYGDVIFDPGATTSVDAFVAESLRLLAKRARGAVLYLTNVRADARAFEPLRSRLRVLRQSTAPYIPLPGTWEEYLASRGKRLREGIGRRQRRIGERGRVEYRLLAPGDPEIASALQSLVSFQRARFDAPWNRTHLFDERYVRFRTGQTAEPRTRVAAVYLDGACVAAGLCAIYRGCFYFIVTGFDSDFAICAPGFLLQAFVIRSCVDNGWDPCDLCWGDEAHKHLWTDSEMVLTSFVSTGVAGSALAAAMDARHAIVALLERSRKKPPAPSERSG